MSFVQERLNTFYRIITLDLATARNQAEIKLEKIYNELTVLQAAAAFQLIIDQNFGEIPVLANQALAISDYCIKDAIYITNVAAVGNAVLWLAGYPLEECD